MEPRCFARFDCRCQAQALDLLLDIVDRLSHRDILERMAGQRGTKPGGALQWIKGAGFFHGLVKAKIQRSEDPSVLRQTQAHYAVAWRRKLGKLRRGQSQDPMNCAVP